MDESKKKIAVIAGVIVAVGILAFSVARNVGGESQEVVGTLEQGYAPGKEPDFMKERKAAGQTGDEGRATPGVVPGGPEGM